MKTIKFKTSDHGRPFKATIYGVEVTGKVSIDNDKVYLCQDKYDGAATQEKFDYKYSWGWGNTDMVCKIGEEVDINSFNFIDEKVFTTKEQILEAASKCDTVKDVLKTLYPDVFEKSDEYFKFSEGTLPGWTKNLPFYIGTGHVRRGDRNKVLIVNPEYKAVLIENYYDGDQGIKFLKTS